MSPATTTTTITTNRTIQHWTLTNGNKHTNRLKVTIKFRHWRRSISWSLNIRILYVIDARSIRLVALVEFVLVLVHSLLIVVYDQSNNETLPLGRWLQSNLNRKSRYIYDQYISMLCWEHGRNQSNDNCLHLSCGLGRRHRHRWYTLMLRAMIICKTKS